MPTDFERVEPSFGDGPLQPPSRDSVPADAVRAEPPPRAGARVPKVPLSRAPGKKKLLVGVPMALVSGAALAAGAGSLAQMFFVAFLAYALVGLLEVILGATLIRAGEAWAGLRWWQRGLASVLVVVASLALVVTVIPALVR